MTNYCYLVPKDTQPIAKQHALASQNFGLVIQRYAPWPWEVIKPTDRKDKRGKVIGKERNFWLQDICKEFKPDSELIASTYQRWQAMTEGALRFTMVSRSRMIIGLGGKGALEFGITLHPVTGLPYIPGSALKGLCRNYILLRVAEEKGITVEQKQLNALDEELCLETNESDEAKQYRWLFGTQSEAGQCVFFDAVLKEIPNNGSLFELDVMTPHFRKYYESGGKDAPHDADSPNPISYITVKANLEFEFAMGYRHNASLKWRKTLELGTEFLQQALDIMGIGAKTAAGYGIFEAVN